MNCRRIASAALRAAAALGGLYDRFARTQGGRIALDPMSEEEREELMSRARAAQSAMFERRGQEIGRQTYAQVTQALGTEALEAEGIALGVRSQLDFSLVRRLDQLLQMRIDELEGFEIPTIETGGDTGSLPAAPSSAGANGGGSRIGGFILGSAGDIANAGRGLAGC